MTDTPKIVLVADSQSSTLNLLSGAVAAAGFLVRPAASFHEAIESFYAQPPQCIITRLEMEDSPCSKLLDEIKRDNFYGHLPVILVARQEYIERGIDWHLVPADDYLIEPLSVWEVASRVRLCLSRALRDVNANPLTGLPGNLTIMREAERRLSTGQRFSFAYLDVDSFKSFNDKYGFSRGDEVLRMTARIIVNAVRSLDSLDTYVGHIGGDDFVFITPCEFMAHACQRIASNFDLIVRDFYDADDRENGFIQSMDRQGKPQTFPLMSVSIGAVDTSTAEIQHVADMFTRVTEVKSFAKRLPGSNFIMDRRRG